MKKLFIYLSAIATFGFTSCETQDTADVSEVTNYAVFTLEGEDEILLSRGEEYVEPGATALEAGEPVEVSTSSSGLFRGGSLDTDVPDIYSVFYTAVNQDGFEASASRTVVVAENGDLETDLSGLYRSTVIRNGVSAPAYTDIEYVLIWEVSPGVYQISDAIGGYYMYGRNYGLGYAAQGLRITVNGPGDYSFNDPIGVGAFGGNLEITEFSTYPATDTIEFVADWDAGYSFKVILEQVEL